MIFGYIYKIYNDVNDKVYVGQTTMTIQKRFEGHIKASTRNVKRPGHLYLAMRKYGVDKFHVVELDTALSREELNEKERYWIKFYNSIDFGYNMMDGGNDENSMNSDIVRKKHDETMRSDEIRKKISESMKKLRTEEGFSKQHLAHIKESRERRKIERAAAGLNFYNHPENYATRSRPVYCICLTTGERHDFKSILDAGRWWYDTFRPFGEIYSSTTYQRKIESSIQNKKITFGVKNTKRYKEITDIQWYYNL